MISSLKQVTRIKNICHKPKLLLQCQNQFNSDIIFRNVYVFERTFPPPHVPGKNVSQERLNLLAKMVPYDKHQQFREVEKEQAPVPVRLIVLRNTEDFGSRGQILTISDPNVARDELLLTGVAVYATEENLEKYKDILIPESERQFSSRHIENILPYFSRLALPVSMNLHNEWKLEPWHLRVCFRRLCFEVAEECIEIAGDKEICGPCLENEGKTFLIYVTINNTERVPIRCVLHHVSDDVEENEKLKNPGWQHAFHEPLFEDQREQLENMPRNAFGNQASSFEHMIPELKKYKEWRNIKNLELYGDMEESQL